LSMPWGRWLWLKPRVFVFGCALNGRIQEWQANDSVSNGLM
jgi:hypothetical protein